LVEIFKIIMYNYLVHNPLLYSIEYSCSRERREKPMAEIRVGENESLDNALKRFKRQCARAGVIGEVRKREHYEKPSVKRKKKSEEARKKKYSRF